MFIRFIHGLNFIAVISEWNYPGFKKENSFELFELYVNCSKIIRIIRESVQSGLQPVWSTTDMNRILKKIQFELSANRILFKLSADISNQLELSEQFTDCSKQFKLFESSANRCNPDCIRSGALPK